MIRQHLPLRLIGFGAIVMVVVAASTWTSDVAPAAPPGAGNTPDAPQDLAAQAKQLQQQLTELQKQVNELSKSRIVAAGTATYTRPALQDNKSFSRIKLSADIASKLGEDYIVLLTNHFPTGGFPYFGAYWKRATEGFDIYLVDIGINDGTTVSYDNPNTKYLIDWAVIKK